MAAAFTTTTWGREIATKVAMGLCHLHVNHIIHLDLK